MRNLLAPLLAMLLVSQTFGCTAKTVVKDEPVGEVPAQEAAEGEDEALPPAAEAETFGDSLNPSNAGRLAVRGILANPEAFKDKQITTEGTVRQVCQKRGCWAEVRPAESRDSETMRVTFKGYAFFLPTDSRGATVKIEGRVSVELHSAEEVQHLEEEGATFTNKRADGSALMTQFIASAVEMTNRKK